VARGDIAAGEGSVWVRTSRELASEIDVVTNAVVRVLEPAQPASGSIAVADGTVWITTQSGHTIHRVATN
jgi:streptogramin lyase